jgi:large subunit ribosomal protein L20
MPRAKNNVAGRKRKKKVLNQAKGAFGARSKVYTVAKHHVEKSMQYAYRDRRNKKRTFRQLWITRINAAARINGTTYSKLIEALGTKDIQINRKVLADLAANHPKAFTEVVKFALA